MPRQMSKVPVAALGAATVDLADGTKASCDVYCPAAGEASAAGESL